MDIIKLTRELGAAIQQDERYLAFTKARETNENDKELMDLLGRIQLLQMNFQQESGKEDADPEKLEAYNKEFEGLYGQFMQNENVLAFEEARKDVDDMMNYIMAILALCVNGADPMTCEPEEHHDHDCGGECSSCSGCH
ncbi:MAG: YlbF family regulator [Acutalibacteraceae bacterium]